MIDLQQPRPLDLVGDPVLVAGQSVVFEANIEWRVTLAGEEASGFFTGGGSVAVRQFQAEVVLSGLGPTPAGEALAHLSVFSTSAADGSVQDLVTVPILIGSRLVQDYEGWQPRVVVSGDTLSGIANQVFGDANAWPVLAEANRHIVANPNLIFPGQVLRIPIGSAPVV